MKMQTSLTQAIGKNELSRNPEWKYFISFGVFPKKSQVLVSREASLRLVRSFAPENSMMCANEPFLICPGVLMKIEELPSKEVQVTFWYAPAHALSAETLISFLLQTGISKAA